MTVTWKADKLIARLRGGVAGGVLNAAHMVEQGAIQRIISGPKSGRVYYRHGVAHQASAPGQSPANETGRLANSSEVSSSAGGLVARVSFNSPHAGMMEMGTQSIEPRPFLRPSLVENYENIRAAVAAGAKKGLK